MALLPPLTQKRLFENTWHIKSNILIIARKYYIEYIYNRAKYILRRNNYKKVFRIVTFNSFCLLYNKLVFLILTTK